MAELDKVLLMPDVIKEVEKFQPLMQNLTEWTGRQVNSSYVMARIYHTLQAEAAMDLELPEWAKAIFPNGELYDAIILDYKITNYNQDLQKLFGGNFIVFFFDENFFFIINFLLFYTGTVLRHIVESMTGIANGTITDGRKINLLSSHESNIASFLITAGIYEPHVPEYSSAIFVELYKDSTEYYVKIFYYLGIPETAVEKPIPNCDTPCTLTKFVDLMKNLLPSDKQIVCRPNTIL